MWKNRSREAIIQERILGDEKGKVGDSKLSWRGERKLVPEIRRLITWVIEYQSLLGLFLSDLKISGLW